jgi:hypothetical protein
MPNLPLLCVCLARGSGSAEGAGTREIPQGRCQSNTPPFFYIVFFYARGLHQTWRQARPFLHSRPLSSTAPENQRYSTIRRDTADSSCSGKGPLKWCIGTVQKSSRTRGRKGGNQRRTKPQRFLGLFLRSLSSTSSSTSSDADSGPLNAFSSCNGDVGSQLSVNTRSAGVQANKQPTHPRSAARARAPHPLSCPFSLTGSQSKPAGGTYAGPTA